MVTKHEMADRIAAALREHHYKYPTTSPFKDIEVNKDGKSVILTFSVGDRMLVKLEDL
jgi:hypothetical protein